jgi:probable F420-dependent oxidoreductase
MSVTCSIFMFPPRPHDESAGDRQSDHHGTVLEPHGWAERESEGPNIAKPIDFGVCLTNYGDVTSPAASIGTARLAEELGYASVWTSDHVLVPPEFGSRFGEGFLDPFICLAYAAAETTRVKLGTTVVVVPLRSPFTQARLLATLDYLSGGRVIFGIGVGWDREEFEALGISFAERGPMTDEYVAIMRELWTAGSPRFAGRYHTFSGAAFEPKPVQNPIPIWVGGYGPAAVRRAVRLRAPWHPSGLSPEKISDMLTYMRSITRDPVPLTYRMYLRPKDVRPQPMRSAQTGFEGDRQETIEYIRRFLSQPITHLVFEFVVSCAEDLRSCFRYLREEVLPAL